jgi:hypothetical protein
MTNNKKQKTRKKRAFIIIIKKKWKDKLNDQLEKKMDREGGAAVFPSLHNTFSSRDE